MPLILGHSQSGAFFFHSTRILSLENVAHQILRAFGLIDGTSNFYLEFALQVLDKTVEGDMEGETNSCEPFSARIFQSRSAS